MPSPLPPSPMPMRRLGAVLAGGAARRFGSDKALAPLGGQPLIAHAAAALAPHVDALVICGRTFADHPSLADRPAPGMGPLGALNAALHHAATRGFGTVLSIACDTPLVPPVLFAALIAEPAGAYLAAHPVVGQWPSRHADALDAFLASAARHSMRGWAEAMGVVGIAGDVPNVNTPEDLAALARSIPAGR